jgi:preprotein translocase subunit SecB
MTKKKEKSITGKSRTGSSVGLAKQRRTPNELDIHLKQVVVRKIDYHEVPVEAPPIRVAPGEEINTKLDINGGVRLREDGFEVDIEVHAIGDPAHAPYEITVKFTALFTISSEATDDEKIEFGINSGTRLLYPFVREMIANITTRGVFGPVLLDPLDVDGIENALS